MNIHKLDENYENNSKKRLFPKKEFNYITEFFKEEAV
jgi:hypothetical protein